MILGNPKRQINDRLDQSIQVTNKVLLVMADNRHIIVAGFWDKSFRIYSTDNAKLEQGMCHDQGCPDRCENPDRLGPWSDFFGFGDHRL